MSKFSFVVDVETSGNDPDTYGVVSCAGLIINENKEVVDTFSRLVRPDMLSKRNWQIEAEAVHRIPFEKVMNEGIPNDQFCFELLCFLSKYRPESGYMPFICHASRRGMRQFKPGPEKKSTGSWEIWPAFDWHFIERQMRKAYYQDNTEMVWTWNKLFYFPDSFISTVNMAREAGYKGNRLNQWAERVKFPLNHHDAMSDVLCCLEIYKFLTSGGKISGDNKLSEDIPF